MKFVLLLLLLAVFAHAAHADVLYLDAVTLEKGCALGPPLGFPTWAVPENGSPLTWVGRVASVGEPFNHDLVPVGYEMTYVFEGSTCWLAETWSDPPCGSGVTGYYTGGKLTIYLDPVPDADFTNLATFSDGDVALTLQTFRIDVTDYDPYILCPVRPDEFDLLASIQVIGGLWADLVSTEGRGYYGDVWGEVDQSVPAYLDFMGYAFRGEGVLRLYSTVATKSTTWGAVKALYR